MERCLGKSTGEALFESRRQCARPPERRAEPVAYEERLDGEVVAQRRNHGGDLDHLTPQCVGVARHVVAVDVDQSQATSEKFGIRAMPTLLMFKGGKVVGQLVGAAPKAKFEAMIRAAL